MDIKSFIANHGLTLGVLSAETNPVMENADRMFNWVCCLTNKRGNVFNFHFSTGGAHIQVKAKLPLGISVRVSGATYTDVTRIKSEIGSWYYNFEKGRFVRHWGATSYFDSQIAAVIFEATPPTLETVLECLATDASVLDYPNFESWASDFGYDDDSISAKKVYDACLNSALQLRHLLGEVGLRELQEMEF